eukprot:286451-Rhodomonas_salina.1
MAIPCVAGTVCEASGGSHLISPRTPNQINAPQLLRLHPPSRLPAHSLSQYRTLPRQCAPQYRTVLISVPDTEYCAPSRTPPNVSLVWPRPPEGGVTCTFGANASGFVQTEKNVAVNAGRPPT